MQNPATSARPGMARCDAILRKMSGCFDDGCMMTSPLNSDAPLGTAPRNLTPCDDRGCDLDQKCARLAEPSSGPARRWECRVSDEEIQLRAPPILDCFAFGSQ